MILPDFVYHR